MKSKHQECCNMSTDKKEEALKAYKTLIDYCSSQEKCDGCLFEIEDGAPGICIMEIQDVPEQWLELDLD